MRGCADSRRYIDVCNCDVFRVVNVYLDHLQLCVVCIHCRMYVCCSEFNVISDECDEHNPSLCNLPVRTLVKLSTVSVFALEVSLVSRIVMIYVCVS